MDASVQQALARFGAGLRGRFGSRLLALRLFGSHARGDSHEDSDVDVLVVLDAVSWPDQLEIARIATEVSLQDDFLLTPTVIDRARLETWRGWEHPLLSSIDAEGIDL